MLICFSQACQNMKPKKVSKEIEDSRYNTEKNQPFLKRQTYLLTSMILN